MQHVFRSAATFLAIGVAFLSVSCNKKAEVQKLAGDAAANYWPDQRYCNIDSIKITNENRWYKFSYNSFGNPVSIITNNTSTGNPNWFFYYDANRRMNKYIRMYDNQGDYFETFKKFVYGPGNRVTYDSSWVFGIVVNGEPTNYVASQVTTYYYDSLGRISRTWTAFIEFPGEGFEKTYNYDANGNLIKPGITYDNRNNIHNTNNWWRLIDKDYSKNNPYRASSYIGYLLPRDFFSDLNTNYRYFLDIDMPHATFTYQCGN
ncbi:hypothetical protein [Pseudobacter ginsenosidimutans]|uniref:Uncharacterized protein n=1 Tax=Pseudobacter ginsenosidimutans TaxID=661488 RepID=A0A4Q7N610_9BACT|nr:hypothetical protein [Pseudobacter ginsenosidimutans]QEC45008.1 hypothetical protein FSB84_26220 [Pseudobacter ginsenosidimutans]RZS76503.1 hypothetical protein EV199_2388 [Pseudobacter ginsenosidimutans]